jgi:hypothetical protein
MWAQAGFDPSGFWEQSPQTFRAIMDGITAKLKAEAEGSISQAWHMAAFYNASQSKGGLKPLKHYVKTDNRKMSSKEMLANMRILAQRANRKIEK